MISTVEHYEVGLDFLDSVGYSNTAREYDYMLVGVSYDDDAYSMFGRDFNPLFCSNDPDELVGRAWDYVEGDIRYGEACSYEVWHVVGGTPDWQRQCCEWALCVGRETAERYYKVTVANVGVRHLDVLQQGAILYVAPREWYEGRYDGYDADWLSGVYEGNKYSGKNVPHWIDLDCSWVDPDNRLRVQQLVESLPEYARCYEEEKHLWTEWA